MNVKITSLRVHSKQSVSKPKQDVEKIPHWD